MSAAEAPKNPASDEMVRTESQDALVAAASWDVDTVGGKEAAAASEDLMKRSESQKAEVATAAFVKPADEKPPEDPVEAMALDLNRIEKECLTKVVLEGTNSKIMIFTKDILFVMNPEAGFKCVAACEGTSMHWAAQCG
jgi:hypothetical protein